MSRLSDVAENILVDMLRGRDLESPAAFELPAAWSFGLASAASDGGFTELSGAGYARQQVTRSLANFAGTQGAGTVLASSGTSHQTSNNNAISFGTAGAAWGTAEYILMFDDTGSPTNLWAVIPLDSPLVINNGDPVAFAAGAVTFTLGLTGGLSDYAANKLIDLIWRGVPYSWPTSVYVAYTTTAPTNAAAGTEPAGGYARVEVESTMDAWAGTQSAGSTTASTGTSGQTSNNDTITFPAPTADQGTITHMMIMDAVSGGNMLFWRALNGSKTVNNGSTAPFFSPGALTITFQ